MNPVLVADIGGATIRFGLVYPDGQLRAVSTSVNDRAATIEDAIGRYLHECEVRPDAAVLAIAGPLTAMRSRSATGAGASACPGSRPRSA
jgi:glucokinase